MVAIVLSNQDFHTSGEEFIFWGVINNVRIKLSISLQSTHKSMRSMPKISTLVVISD